MEIVSSFTFSLAIILTSIELSTHTSNAGPDVPRSETPHSVTKHPSLGSSSRSSPPAEPPTRTRSKSPHRPSPLYILGYTLESIKFIRLIPHTNPSRQFAIQRYTFPCGKPIYLRGNHHVLESMPAEEQTVLSTANREVFAIVKPDRRLRGMYMIENTIQKRVKLNMYSGGITEMTIEEVGETPLGSRFPISKCFGILNIETELISQTMNPGTDIPRSGRSYSLARQHAPGSSSSSPPNAEHPHCSRSRSPTTSDFSSYIIGYKLEELKYIRLIPNTNPSRRFEIRRYIFPRDGSIKVKGELQILMPMPSEEQTVLSTVNREVFAIVEARRRLRGMYIMKNAHQKRVKVDMYSGAVKEMTKAEIRETPLGKHAPISKCFEVVSMNDSPPRPIRFPTMNKFEG